MWEPNPGPQTAFLAATAREVLTGGAVGGGKSQGLIAMPLRWADHPKHRALILRRERKRLQELIDRARPLYEAVLPGVQWHETELRFRLPAGGFIRFGYAEHEKDVEAYKSDEYNLIEVDELTEWTEYMYKYMLSRNRSKAHDLPPFMRAATNPGGEGMDWVFRRFIEHRRPYQTYAHRVQVEGLGDLVLTRQFIPSTVFDNPKLANRDEYIAGLADLDAETREALLYGRWDKFRGQFFPQMPASVTPALPTDDWYVIRAMDYGWGDETCVLWLVVSPSRQRLDVAAEVYGSQLTTDSIAQMIQAVESDLGLGSRVLFSVISPDAFKKGPDRGQSIADMLRDKGVWFVRADSDRINGWARIVTLIRRNKLGVWEGRAPNLMRTLPKLPRDPQDGRDVRKRGVEDHAAEALRYGCMAFMDTVTRPVSPKPPSNANRDTAYDQLVQSIGQPRATWLPGLGAGW